MPGESQRPTGRPVDDGPSLADQHVSPLLRRVLALPNAGFGVSLTLPNFVDKQFNFYVDLDHIR